MDNKALDKALQEIINCRAELSKIDYNNPTYDDLEEKLHDLEDDFQDSFGDFMEEALQTVHDKYCPDNDVLLPIAYIGTGIPVDVDQFPGKDARLVLKANPTQIILNIGKDKQEVVWSV